MLGTDDINFIVQVEIRLQVQVLGINIIQAEA
jgi:hypothetical protein